MVLAQQLIDASKDGGAAFLAFAIMVFLFVGSLFYMDKIRKRRRAEPLTVEPFDEVQHAFGSAAPFSTGAL